MIQLDVIKGPQSWALLLLLIGWILWRTTRQGKSVKPQVQLPSTTTDTAKSWEDGYYNIEPVGDGFRWEATEPLKLRPFKPKYHLTMALENTTMSDLCPIDKTYLERLEKRRKLIRNQPHDVLAANPKVYPAILEFYTWIMGTFLPSRYPTMFQLIRSNSTKPASQLKNLVTKETIPTVLTDAIQALTYLGEHVDDDFLWLLPSSDPADEGKYKLEGFITCFTSGFYSPAKLNLKLADIHGPIPHYKEKLEKSMDRFFASLAIGKIVKRVNWTITTHTDLFTVDRNHLSEAEFEEMQKRGVRVENAGYEEVDLEQTLLRCERQTLHRLPESKALVFAFKTYTYPIKELKEEGSGEVLAQAIDGLGTGSVPRIAIYKKQVIWGEKVKAFLRS